VHSFFNHRAKTVRVGGPRSTLSSANGKRPRPYAKSGLYELKRSVLTLGRHTIDRRTTVGKALAAWRSDLLVDLGGVESISTEEAALIDAAVKTKLILDSVDAWLLSQPTLINKRSRSVVSAVRDRNALVATLKGLLESLGLKRRAKPVMRFHELVAQLEQKAKDEAPKNADSVSAIPEAKP
jgi:hypothetical protein